MRVALPMDESLGMRLPEWLPVELHIDVLSFNGIPIAVQFFLRGTCT